MRKHIMLIGLATLAACKGQGPETVGGNAPPIGSGGAGNGSGESTHSFVNPTETKTYSAIGGVHSYQYSTDDRNVAGQYAQLYAGDASTARNSGITVTYDPRDAIFDVKIASTAAGVNNNNRFQDPAHRTDFGDLREPQEGTPDLTAKGVRFLQAGGSTGTVVYGSSDTFPVGEAAASRNVSTFFYQKAGTSTNYVTFAGYVRNATNITEITRDDGTNYLRQDHILERAAFAYGERTQNNAVPRTGTGSYTGNMLATMVYNPLIDTHGDAPTYFQWIDGTATINVDFADSTVATTFAGSVTAPQMDIFTSGVHAMPAGSAFTATGTARVDLVNAGGFIGQMDSASFTTSGNSVVPVDIAGSSVDGAFFGPAAQEVGGGFRVVGGTPDERIDILGTFTAAKP